MAGQLTTIRLSRGDSQPWGFRLQGGKDWALPLSVSKVSPATDPGVSLFRSQSPDRKELRRMHGYRFTEESAVTTSLKSFFGSSKECLRERTRLGAETRSLIHDCVSRLDSNSRLSCRPVHDVSHVVLLHDQIETESCVRTPHSRRQ